jgi:NitT/TauT family transport system substrate-binding protein
MRRYITAHATKFAYACALTTLIGSAAQANEINVTQWGNSLYGAPFAVAMEDGDFDEAGVSVTAIIGSGGGGTSVRNTLASATPYGEVALPAALAAARQGLDIVIVNTGTRTVAESTLVTMPDSSIDGLEDLVGRKVAITNPKSTSEMIVLQEMEALGIEPDQIERIASGGYTQGLTMLEQGVVDAAVLIEPLSLTRADDYKTVVRAKEILPAMTTSVGITTPQFAADNPELIRALIAGRREAVRSIYADPEAAAAKIAKQFNMDGGLAKQATLNMIEPRMWSEGEFNQEELTRLAEGLVLVGEITEMPDWDTLIDESFLPEDLQSE